MSLSADGIECGFVRRWFSPEHERKAKEVSPVVSEEATETDIAHLEDRWCLPRRLVS
ncbi:hypothetical protein GS429_09205 [Natronorubrum sp. JWXQ-INN-674]|uniref:Uncharacterized protein n=1 Tax=Natronorubrum halalkaliphilum TaxID=2691917 RepID=A0A6B0VM56_9EURY|nr:hypothetical protein [Natronorubrum halalkaliphilum]MXV62235.1 hypothetical protein [Natronorubrum halalkaliphilum]